jgi:hypothetical protein
VTRVIDPGARVAGWVGLGMAVTIAVSFLLVIPIEAVYWYLALPAGLLIGYYANQRSGRGGGPFVRQLANALWAGLLTAVVYAVLLLGVKALFFVADDGYRDASAGGRLSCVQGGDCVYQRYLAEGRGEQLRAVGVTDPASFSRFYWDQQISTAGLLFALTLAGAAGGGLVFAATNRRRDSSQGVTGAEAAEGAGR